VLRLLQPLAQVFLPHLKLATLLFPPALKRVLRLRFPAVETEWSLLTPLAQRTLAWREAMDTGHEYMPGRITEHVSLRYPHKRSCC
jgi:hypothetical protein